MPQRLDILARLSGAAWAIAPYVDSRSSFRSPPFASTKKINPPLLPRPCLHYHPSAPLIIPPHASSIIIHQHTASYIIIHHHPATCRGTTLVRAPRRLRDFAWAPWGHQGSWRPPGPSGGRGRENDRGGRVCCVCEATILRTSLSAARADVTTPATGAKPSLRISMPYLRALCLSTLVSLQETRSKLGDMPLSSVGCEPAAPPGTNLWSRAAQRLPRAPCAHNKPFRGMHRTEQDSCFRSDFRRHARHA